MKEVAESRGGLSQSGAHVHRVTWLVPYLAGSARAPRSVPRRPKVLAIAAAKMSSSFAEGDESVSTYLRQLMSCLNVQLALY